MDALREMLTTDVASFYVQQPNFHGLFEDARRGCGRSRRARQVSWAATPWRWPS